MIGSTVNPALGRIDYSPITQGAQSAAQSIQNAGQAYGQMFSNLGNVGAQVFGALAKQKQEEKQYQSIISSTKAFVSNVDQLKDVSPEIKDWVKKTSATLDDSKLTSQQKAVLAQTLSPMYNSVIGSAVSQSMADDARKKQATRIVTALKQNQSAGVAEQLRTPGMTFEKLNVAAKASPQQTISLLLEQGVPLNEAVTVYKSIDDLDRKKTEAEIGLIEAQMQERLAPKSVTLTDTDKELNDRIAAKQAQLGRAITATEKVELRDAMKAPTAGRRAGEKKDLILEDPETGKKKTVPSVWDGNEWRDEISEAPIYLSPPGMFGGGGKTINPSIFGRASTTDLGANVRDFNDLLKPKK
jgi:myosin heavy subunit